MKLDFLFKTRGPRSTGLKQQEISSPTSEGFVVTRKSVKLHWLAWLLQAGSSMIVSGYEYTPSFEGRSGGGVMTGGGVWRVPPEFSGTESDNFITRALNNRDKQLSQLLKGLFN